MSINNPNRARMMPAPTPIFQPGPGARAREGGAPPNTGYNTSAWDAEASYLSSLPPRTNISLPQFSEEARGALMGGLGANLALSDQIPAFEAWTMRRYNNAQQPTGDANAGPIPSKGGAINLQTGPVDYGGQHAALGRYRPPMFDLQGNPDPRDLGGYAYNLPNQYGPYPLNQYAGRFMAQDIYNNQTLASMLANRQTGIIDMLRAGLLRMLASGPQAAYTVPQDQTQPVTDPGQAPPVAEEDPYSASTPYPPVQQGTPGRGGAGGPLPFLPGGMSGWTRFRRRRDDVAPMPEVWTA